MPVGSIGFLSAFDPTAHRMALLTSGKRSFLSSALTELKKYRPCQQPWRRGPVPRFHGSSSSSVDIGPEI